MKNYETVKHGTADFPIGIHDTFCASGFQLYPHVHREFEFLVMVKGSGTVLVEEEKISLGEGEGVFINSGELHVGIKNDEKEAEFFAIVFAPEIFGDFGRDVIVKKYVLPVMEGEIVPKRRIDKSVTEKLSEIHMGLGELKTKAKLYEIWDECVKSASLCEKENRKRSLEEIKSVMEYVKENAEREISLDEMAKQANMSKGNLCREFKKAMQMTPFEYLTQVRISKGCELLKNTELPICEIAGMCGFNSFSYFTKVFKERMGVAPKKYRQNRSWNNDGVRR